MSDINDILQPIFGGSVLGVAGVLAFSKLRKILFHDSADAATQGAVKDVMDMLREENRRLQDEVSRLRSEIGKLEGMIDSLKNELKAFVDKQTHADRLNELGRAGAIERRSIHRTSLHKPRVKIAPDTKEGWHEVTRPLPVDVRGKDD